MSIGDWTSNSHRLSGSPVIDLSKLCIAELETEVVTFTDSESSELDLISVNEGSQELLVDDTERIKRLRFEERFCIAHPENGEGTRSGICLSYRAFMDFVFPVLANEIEGKTKQEAIQILLDYQNDYGTITLSSCKYNLEQLVLAYGED